MHRPPRPLPFVGAVIDYQFLFGEDAAAGRAASKARPCVIVHVARMGSPDRVEVLVCPVTHSAPRVPERAITLDSAHVRRRAGLDDAPQWVIASEVNEFDWPAFEIVYTPNGEAYRGELDRAVTTAVRTALADASDAGYAARVRRPVASDGPADAM